MHPEWDTATDLAQKPIQDALSSQYAKGVEGIATCVQPSGYEGKVWSFSIKESNAAIELHKKFKSEDREERERIFEKGELTK